MTTIKRSIEVEAKYLVTAYMPDGNVLQTEVEDDHEAAILGLLRSAEEGTIMVKVTCMYMLVDEPMADLQMVCINGGAYFEEDAGGESFMDNLREIAYHALSKDRDGISQAELDTYVWRVADTHMLLDQLPKDVHPQDDREAKIERKLLQMIDEHAEDPDDQRMLRGYVLGSL